MSTLTNRITASTDRFAPDVEWRQETCRGQRQLITAVHHRNGHAIYVEPADIEAALRNDHSVGRVRCELRDDGFLAGSTPTNHDCVAHVRQPGAGLVWRGADRFVRRCYDGVLHHLFGRRWVAAQIGFGVAGTVAIAVAIFGSQVQLRAAPAQIPAIVGLGLIAVAIHELGHALVTVHYGRHVRSVGLRLHLGLPAFYVDSLDALLLSRPQRIVQAAAGPFAEWNVTALAAFVLLALPSDGTAAVVLHRFVIVNAIGVAINLLPFVGLDGALLFADVVRVPDLAMRSRTALLMRRRTAARDRWLVGYAIANGIVATLLLVSAVFFWWQLFGELIHYLLAAGSLGVMVLLVVALTSAVPLARAALTLWCTFTPHIGRLYSRLAFRLERRWRQQAMAAFRVLPEIAQLDETALGILAGHLQRVDARTSILQSAASHVYLDRCQRRGRTASLKPNTQGAVLAVASANTEQVLRSARALVLLPRHWRQVLATRPALGTAGCSSIQH